MPHDARQSCCSGSVVHFNMLLLLYFCLARVIIDHVAAGWIPARLTKQEIKGLPVAIDPTAISDREGQIRCEIAKTTSEYETESYWIATG